MGLKESSDLVGTQRSSDQSQCCALAAKVVPVRRGEKSRRHLELRAHASPIQCSAGDFAAVAVEEELLPIEDCRQEMPLVFPQRRRPGDTVVNAHPENHVLTIE